MATRGVAYLDVPICGNSAELRRGGVLVVAGGPAAAYDFMGADRFLYASDRPWVSPTGILDGLRSMLLPADEETKVLGGNASKLFAR